MALTGIDAELVNRLRIDVGDNPTDVSGNPIVADQIWTDDEHLIRINSSMTTLYNGAVTDKNLLSEFDKEIIILDATIYQNFTLAQDASRYVKYKLRDIDVEKLDPSQFLAVARALQSRLKELLHKSDNENTGESVTEGYLTRYNKTYGQTESPQYEPPSTLPRWYLSSDATGVKITIAYSFIKNYDNHFIKRLDGADSTNGTILKTYTVIEDSEYIDTDANVDGTTYYYELFVQNINGYYTSEKKSLKYSP